MADSPIQTTINLLTKFLMAHGHKGLSIEPSPEEMALTVLQISGQNLSAVQEVLLREDWPHVGLFDCMLKSPSLDVYVADPAHFSHLLEQAMVSL